MIKITERLLTIVLVCLIGYLAFDLVRQTEGEAVPVMQETTEPGAQGTMQQITEPGEQGSMQQTTEPRTQGTAQETAALPARYDAREVGRMATVRSQGTLGTCWAITATSAMEAYFLPQERWVFSPDHLSLRNSFSKGQNDGGAYTMAMAYLAAWQGPVLEEDDPYGDGYSPENLAAVKHVQEIQMFKNKDYDAIKRAVYQYGAVQSAIYMDLDNAFSSSVYYNQLVYSYLYDGDETANHDVLIIGWDDDYEASQFNRNTTEKGAFICQNSWGEKFGDGGVFYVSYADRNIGNQAVAYTKMEDTDNYDHIYQTDLCGWVGQLGYGDESCFAANIYTAMGNEDLKAVGFYATGQNTEYEIYIVEDFEDEASFYKRRSLKKGALSEAGYYTIELEEPLQLQPGQRYAVVLEIHTPGSQYPVATEYMAGEATKTVDISDGEGYISHNGIIWVRSEEEHQANVCLKAYTGNRRE